MSDKSFDDVTLHTLYPVYFAQEWEQRAWSQDNNGYCKGIVLSFSVDLATAADSKKMAAIRHAENELMSFESFSSCCKLALFWF